MAASNMNRIFLGAASFYFASVGLQGVIFSSLVVFTLQADPLWVGTAQSALMLPSVFFVLVGGHVADRVDRRRLLIGLCVVAGLLSLSLLAIVASENLSLPLLIVYALCAGTVQAFVMPARDSMLSDVTAGDLSRAVAGLLIAQWGSQAAGALLGSSARFVGIETAIVIHVALTLGGIPMLALLPRSPNRAASTEESTFAGIISGVQEVWRTPILRVPFLLAATVGVFGIGPYIVVLPVLVRNIYNGGIGELGMINSAFPLGTIAGSLLVLRTGIRRKGRAQGFALGSGALCILAIAAGIPFPATLAAVLAWGTSAAIFMNAGRSIFQEKAPPTHRGRVLSVYTLGFMGTSGLIGAPLFGLLLDAFGVHGSLAIAAAATLVVVALIGASGGYRIVDGLETAPRGGSDEA